MLKTLRNGAISAGLAFGLAGCNENPIHISNVSTEGWFVPTIHANLVNASSNPEEVIVYLKQGDNTACPRTTFLQAGQERKISFDCSDINEGNFKIVAMPASSAPSNLASRALSVD